MKKLGMGMEMSGWLISMPLILPAKYDETVMKACKFCHRTRTQK